MMANRVTAIIPKTVSVVRHDDDDGGMRHVDMMDLMDLIEEVAQEAQARKGEKGEPGIAGTPGRDGKDGEPGRPGRDGIDGVDGAPGKDGKDGQPGRDGKDGRPGIAPDHEIDQGKIRFKKPDGTWGAWLAAPEGQRGKSGGVVTVFDQGSLRSEGTQKITVAASAPSSPSVGDIWIDTN
jgi:hypothetical protein